MEKVSIIIGTCNHCEDLLKPCCEALIKYTNLEDKEVIIVSNGSKDNTRECVESLGKPFKLLWFDDQLGYSKANNEGIKIATGDYLVLLNDDAFLLPQEKDAWINMLMKPFNDEKVGITGPVKASCDARTFYEMNINKTPTFFAEFIMFFCAMIKREVIEKIGLLDEMFKNGCEDVDFSIRVNNFGYNIVQIFNSYEFPMYHKGQSTILYQPKYFEENIENNALLIKKHSMNKIG